MKISIIIPLFNIEENLFIRCIESILEQTNDNWECIIIDDGSNNNVDYYQIINKYNLCTKFIYKKQINQGLPISRNNGLKLSTGDLIWFIDPDDYIYDKNAINKIFDIFQKNDIDFLNFKYIEEYKKRKNINTKIKHTEGIVYNNEKNQKLINLFEPFHSVWRNIYKRDILIKNKLFHQNKKTIYEDVYFDLILKSSTKKIYITNEIFYVYNRKNTNSICNRTNNFKKKNKIFIQNIMEAYQWTKLNNKNINLFYIHSLYYYHYFPFLDKNITTQINEFVKINNFNISLNQKISFLISKSFLLTFIYRIVITFIFYFKKIINKFIRSYKII